MKVMDVLAFIFLLSQLAEPFVVQGQAQAEEWVVMFPEQEYIFGDFTERLWAYLTIQQLLNKQ